MPKLPLPSKSADRVMEYLEIVDSAQLRQGFAKRYDFFKRTPNEAYTSFIIGYLKDNLLTKEVGEEKYCLTKKGETCLHIMRRNRDLVGLFTQDLSGDRIRQS